MQKVRNARSYFRDNNVSVYLIPVHERLKFVLSFVLTTGIINFFALILRNHIFNSGLEFHRALEVLFTGIVWGLALGLTQWLILRRYISNHGWITATACGITILSCLSLVEFKLMQTIDMTSSSNKVTFIFFGIVLKVIQYFWLLIPQWQILRKEVSRSWQWFLIPIIKAIPSYLIAISYFIAVYFNLENFKNIPGLWELRLFTLPMIQGIFLCNFLRLNTSYGYGNYNSQTPLNLRDTPIDFFNFSIGKWHRNRKILRKLKAQIYQYQVKKKNLPRKLVYLLQVHRDASIFSYKPMNLAAKDYVKYTPLPDLVRNTNQQPTHHSLLQLKVIFSTTSKIKIQPVINWSLFLVSIITIIAVMATSIGLYYLAEAL
ncbi:MAG: hypothetical protein AAF316_14635 [Cyanobacteria bacterium P01_A01_bin.80]